MTAGLHPHTMSSSTCTTEDLPAWANGIAVLRTLASPALFSFRLMIADQSWSIQSLHWLIRAPQYSCLVEKTIWRLNRSPVAKRVNSGVVTIVRLGGGTRADLAFCVEPCS